MCWTCWPSFLKMKYSPSFVFQGWNALIVWKKISRWIGLSSKFKHNSNRINRRNGFHFLFSANSIIILISSSIIARVEHHNFIDDIWWSVATVTTVGYGDIVPKNLVGKAVAVVLMFSGIATLGLLTALLIIFFSFRSLNWTKNSWAWEGVGWITCHSWGNQKYGACYE